MPIYKDQLQREIILTAVPKRIISLVPSQTELLFELGLDKEVAGITKFCVHPEEWFRTKPRIGGTKTIKTDAVAALKPDLIIANKEENIEAQIIQLEKIAPVWVSDINTVDDAFEMIYSIGMITDTIEKAKILIAEIKKSFEILPGKTQVKKYRTAYLIWKDPYMSVGVDTFIHDMMQCSGFENVLGDQTRYPEIDIEMLREKNTELLLLSSEPYPFKQKHIDELQLQLPRIKIILVDGEIFSWYGSRMRYAAKYIHALLAKINS